MSIDLISTAIAQAAQDTTRRSAAPIWPMLLAIFAVFYFFIIRPQHTKQKDSQKMLDSLAKGDHVITIGGICGTIVNIKEKKDNQSGNDIIVLKVADNTKLEMIRSSIAKVIQKNSEAGKESK